jgi:hypothetical protein
LACAVHVWNHTLSLTPGLTAFTKSHFTRATICSMLGALAIGSASGTRTQHDVPIPITVIKTAVIGRLHEVRMIRPPIQGFPRPFLKTRGCPSWRRGILWIRSQIRATRCRLSSRRALIASRPRRQPTSPVACKSASKKRDRGHREKGRQSSPENRSTDRCSAAIATIRHRKGESVLGAAGREVLEKGALNVLFRLLPSRAHRALPQCLTAISHHFCYRIVCFRSGHLAAGAAADRSARSAHAERIP